MASDSLRLHTFGGLWLRNAAGPLAEASSQRRRLALLALVAAAGPAGVSRDRVLAYLWPASNEEHARHSLAQLVYSMRRTLDHSLISGDAEFRLDRESLTSDIDEFLLAADPTRLSALYAGPFLDGFHLSDAPEFGYWVERERERTTGMACVALETLGKAAFAKGDFASAVDSWRRRVAIGPLDSAPAIALMEALFAAGDRTAAVRHARVYETLMRSEMEMEPDPQVIALAERFHRPFRSPPATPLSAGNPVASEIAGVSPAQAAAVGSPEAGSKSEGATTPARRPWQPRSVGIAALVTVAIATTVVLAWPRPDIPELMAVGDVRFLAADTSANANTFTDMLATSLARLHGVQMLSNARVQEVLSAIRRTDTTAASVGAAAARAGATEVLEGTVRGSRGNLQLDLRRVDLESGAIRRVYRVSGVDPFALADAATAALALDLRVRAPSTPLASVTTRSLPAYRLYEEGLRLFYDGDAAAAFRLFNAALVEDSTFPMAAYYTWRTATAAGPRQEAQALERLRRVASGATERERLFIEGTIAAGLFEISALAVAESLATLYPSEPDAHLLLGSVRSTTGDFAGAARSARLVRRMEAGVVGEAPQCRVCDAFNLEISALIAVDSLDRAELVAHEWVGSYPRALGGYARLADVLERANRLAEAEAAVHATDSIATTPRRGDPRPSIYAIRAGRFPEVDQRLRAALHGTPEEAASARWLLLISLRNQGRFAEALTLAREPASMVVLPQQALGHAYFEAGLSARSASYFDSLSKVRSTSPSSGMHARMRTWALAHLATALAAGRDTARLAFVASDLERTGAASLYGRDRLLHHYARGMLLRVRGDSAGAIDELRKSISSLTEGFTRENYELGRMLMQTGRPREAIAVLAPALRGSIDASNYYVSRTELHELLGEAYSGAGRRDSAAAEFRIVAAAWVRADPPFRARGVEAGRRAAELDPSGIRVTLPSR